MANYNVDIAVALKGAEKLGRFNKQIQDFGANVKGANIFLESFSKGTESLVRNVDNLQKNLSLAKTNLRNVALGTKEATIAAAQFLKAQDEVNKGLAQQQELLDDLSGATAKKTAADNQRLQDALYKLELNQTRKLEGKFETRQRFQEEFKQEITKINEQRKKENQLLKENVLKTKQSVAEEIKKKFSIMASHKERRRNIQISEKEIERTKGLIPINERINAQLRKRGLILSENGKKIVKNNQNQAAGARGRGLGNTASSAIIGGTFPLLFGQTGAAATGGAIGGATGGLIGGQFGFALSIAGTAIGQYIDQQDKLNRSITKANSLFVSMGNGAGFSAKEVKNLAKEIGVTAEEVVQMVDASKRFGKEGSDAFISFFGADFSKRMGQIDAIAQIDSVASSMKAIQALSNDITLEDEFRLINMARQEGSLAVQIELQRIILELQHKQNLQEAERIKLGTRFNVQMAKAAVSVVEGLTGYKGLEVKDVQQIIQDEIDETIMKYEEMDGKLVEQIEKIKLLAQTYGDTRLTVVGEIEAINKELKVMMDMQTRIVEISRDVSDAFADSFKGLVKGTMTAQQALASFFQKVADSFLDMAAQMIAKQIQMKILGIGMNLFGGGLSFGKGDLGINKASDYLGDVGNPFKAEGGPVSGGRSYIVGEKGPEVFTPGISGGITPNHALGGSTNISVNIDASGTSVEGSEPNGEELGRLVAAAIQSELIKEKRPGGLLS